MSRAKKFRKEDAIERDIEKTQSKLDQLEEELRKHPRRIKKILDEADIPRVVYELVDKGYLTRLVTSQETSIGRTVAAGCAVLTEDEWSCEIDLEGETFFFFASRGLGEQWDADFKIRDDLGDDQWEAMVRKPKAKTIARAIASELLLKLM